MSFMEKLVNIKHDLKSPKGQRNDFGKFNYRSCEDILVALKPLLQKYNVDLNLDTNLVCMNGNVYVEAVALLTDGENQQSSKAYAREPQSKKGMSDEQITGSAISYARKYALAGLFAIDNTKDADTMDNNGPEKKEPQEYPDVDFQKNREAWGKLIAAGRYSVDQIVAKVEAQGFNMSAFHRSILDGYVRGQ